MPLRSIYDAFQYETQKEYAQEMMNCILDGSMKDIVFQGNKLEYLKYFHRLCDNNIQDNILKKEVKKNYSNWIIVKSSEKWAYRCKKK